LYNFDSDCLMASRTSVSSADFIRNIGYWQNEALRQPISITHHGRDRLVLATPDVFVATHASPDVEKELEVLRADIAALQANLDDGFLVFDAALKIRGSNAVIEAFAGLAREDLNGAGIHEVLPEPFASILADRVQRVLRTRQPERFEVGVPDGRHLAVTVFPMSAGVAALLRNVTELHVLRQRLEDGLALHLILQRCSGAALIRLDGRARIEEIDDAFTKWSGFTAADVVGHRAVDLVAASQRREAAELIDRVLREGGAREMKVNLLGRRGNEIAGDLSLAPILTDFAAHGAFALFVPASSVDSTQQAA
jgi:PAS domain S-box-containing protein